MTKFTVTVMCDHIASRRWWLLGTASPDVSVYLHGCDGCAAMAERAGIDVEECDDPR